MSTLPVVLPLSPGWLDEWKKRVTSWRSICISRGNSFWSRAYKFCQTFLTGRLQLTCGFPFNVVTIFFLFEMQVVGRPLQLLLDGVCLWLVQSFLKGAQSWNLSFWIHLNLICQRKWGGKRWWTACWEGAKWIGGSCHIPHGDVLGWQGEVNNSALIAPSKGSLVPMSEEDWGEASEPNFEGL